MMRPVLCVECQQDYNNCIGNCISKTDLLDHPYNTETSTDWTVSMEGAEEIILTFDKLTKFETNYDDFFYLTRKMEDSYQSLSMINRWERPVIIPEAQRH